MPMPEYGQNFVKPQSGGTGSWMAKLFGGISDDKRARQMAQIQYDLHVAKGTFDTGEQGTREKQKAAAKAAGSIYEGEGKAKTAKKTFRDMTAPKEGEEFTRKDGTKGRRRGGLGIDVDSLAGFDANMLPRFQSTSGERAAKAREATAGQNPATTSKNPPDNNPPGGTPPSGKRSRKKTSSSASTTPGYVQDELPLKPKSTKKSAAKKPTAALDSTPSSTPVTTSTSGEAKPELFPGFGMDVTKPKLPKTPKTPKAGA
jgi:hypothetical protein